MRLQYPFATITPTVDGDVLAVLARANAAFTVGDLHRTIPQRSAEGIRKTITRLVLEGVVTRTVSGRTHAYRLNQGHLAAPAVIALASLESELLDRVRTSIGDWSEAPVYAALFGSAARGEMQDDSDIDIFLVRDDLAEPDVFQSQADVLAAKITTWTGNDARPLIYQVSEIGPGDPVLISISSEGKTLAGDPVWFRGRIVVRGR